MKNMGKDFVIPMPSLGGVHLISGIAHLISVYAMSEKGLIFVLNVLTKSTRYVAAITVCDQCLLLLVIAALELIL